MFRLERRGRWLVAAFDRPQRVLGWAIVGGGFHDTATIAWLEVRNEELTVDVDPVALVRARMAEEGVPDDATVFVTSTALDGYGTARAEADGCVARCVATVGLSNALRPGDPTGPYPRVGTINLLVACEQPLADAALVEAIALVAEARAVALLEAGVVSVRTGLAASGTGTDCIAVAAPHAGEPLAYCGKHTAIGAAIGRAVLEAVSPLARRALAARAARS